MTGLPHLQLELVGEVSLVPDSLMVWESEAEDGGYVEVADQPDRDVAGQYVADEWGLVVVFDGRHAISTQDCECVPPTQTCYDTGLPCVVREQVDCWGFLSIDEPKRVTAADLDDRPAYWPKGTRPEWARPADEPAPLPVAPGQLEAFA